MELKEIIKIIKNNLAIILSFVVLGGVIAVAIISSQPVRYQGNFYIYLNETPSEKNLQSYNEFYAMESLGQVSDFLVEWGKGKSFGKQEFSMQIKKRTAIYLEGMLSAGSEAEAKKGFDDTVNMATAKIKELNNGIFLNDKITASFSDFNVIRMKTDFWRYFGAGIFGGLIVGIFAAFAKFYFKEEK